jgi:hypothetical protein
VFTPAEEFWGTHNFWAPEVHTYEEKYYLFATFTAANHCRGTQILVSDSPMGPFLPVSDEPATPLDWECLDGTFFLDEDAQPWIIFCHEWVQINDGEICARKLSKDLSTPLGNPILLFKASEASWPKALPRRDGTGLVDAKVTDGPFLHRNREGTLVMLWSSVSPSGYAMGYATSESGAILGPWKQQDQPLVQSDGGHGMIFETFDCKLYLTYHSPNKTPDERPFFVPLIETAGGLACR